jgi:hypothetical protein
MDGMSYTCDVSCDFYGYTEPVARKQHHCCECSAPILKGEKHFAYRGKWEDNLETGRQHLLCMEACMLVRDHLEGECIRFGSLGEWFDEMRHEEFFRTRRAEHWAKLRKMMAAIKRRERKAASPAG